MLPSHTLLLLHVDTLPIKLGGCPEFCEQHKQTQKQVDKLEEEIKQIDARKGKLVEAVETGALDIGAVKARNDELDKQRSVLRDKINSLSHSLAVDEEELREIVEEAKEEEIEAFNEGDPELRRRKYLSLIETARIKGDRLIIRYKNSKTFVVTIPRYWGRRKKKAVETKVGFNGKVQYRCEIDPTTESVSFLETAVGDDFSAYVDSYYRRSIS